MSTEATEAARKWYEQQERERLAACRRGDGSPMFDDATIETVAPANARNLAPLLAAYASTLTEEKAKLRALVQVLVDRHGEVKWDAENCDWSCERCGNDYGMKETDLYDSTCQALAAAKEQGFTPTNTERETDFRGHVRSCPQSVWSLEPGMMSTDACICGAPTSEGSTTLAPTNTEGNG